GRASRSGARGAIARCTTARAPLHAGRDASMGFADLRSPALPGGRTTAHASPRPESGSRAALLPRPGLCSQNERGIAIISLAKAQTTKAAGVAHGGLV